MPRAVRLLVVLVVIFAIGGAYWYSQRPPASLTLTGVVTTNEIVASSQIAGRIARLLVAEGDPVKAGQTIAVLQPDELREERAFYEYSAAGLTSQVRESEAALRLQELQTRDQIAQAEANLASTESQQAAVNAELENARITLARAQRMLKDGIPEKSLPPVKLAVAREADVRKVVREAQRVGRALTGFEPFGRDVLRTHYVLTARGGFELYASWEVQQCFGNSFLEILTGPNTEPERLATIAAIRTLCDKLKQEGAVSTFTLAPADDVGLASVYLANGFRRSAVLARHIVQGSDRKDAILWSKKLVIPES